MEIHVGRAAKAHRGGAKAISPSPSPPRYLLTCTCRIMEPTASAFRIVPFLVLQKLVESVLERVDCGRRDHSIR